MAVTVAARQPVELHRWTCWRCGAYLGEKAPNAQAAAHVRCWRCGKINRVAPAS